MSPCNFTHSSGAARGLTCLDALTRELMRVTFCLAWLVAQAAHAQPAPDAGALDQQRRRDAEQQQLRTAPQRDVTPDRPAQDQGKRRGEVLLSVREFRFVGNTLIPLAELQVAVAPYIGPGKSLDQLQAAADAVAAFYRARGWLARVFLPKQDVTEGVVTIEIVEARFGTLRLQGADVPRLPQKLIEAMVSAQQATGAPLNLDAVDRAVLLVDDLPGVGASSKLEAGEQSGQTNLVMELKREPVLRGEALLDNFGATSTGESRANLNLTAANPLGLADLWTTALMKSQGSQSARLAGSLPVGAHGARLGANVSMLDYKVIGGEFQAAQAMGAATSAGMELLHPLVRSQSLNLQAQGGIESRRYRNEVAGAVTSDYELRLWSATLSGNSFDRLGAGGVNSFLIGLTFGDVDLQGSPNQAQDAASARTAGRYTKWRLSVARQQAFNEEFSALVSLQAQGANKNLDSSERLYLGGPYGVRAHSASQGAGDSGSLVNIELRYRLSPQWSALTFYDHGRVKVYHDAAFTQGTVPLRISLQGLGLGLNWVGPDGWAARMSWARPMGDDHSTTPGGKSVPVKFSDQFWLVLSKGF